jgi:hypothetical protein
MEFSGIFIIYFRTEFYMFSSGSSLVIIIKQKTNLNVEWPPLAYVTFHGINSLLKVAFFFWSHFSRFRYWTLSSSPLQVRTDAMFVLQILVILKVQMCGSSLQW